MKQMHILFFILATLLSCNKNDEKTQIQDLLIGQWKLTAFVDEENGTSIESSDPNYFDPVDDTEVLIIINFKENSEYEGVTSRNTFGGDYTLNNSETVLIFYDFFTTDVNESEFGYLFFDNLQLNFNTQTQNYENSFELNENVLKLYYSGKEYMKFVRQ